MKANTTTKATPKRITLNLPADPLRRALLCTANDSEPRRYLRCVHLEPAGYLVGLNGHVLYHVELGQQPLEEAISFRVYGAPLARTTRAALTLDDEGGTLRTFYRSRGRERLCKVLGVDRCSEAHPNWRKALPAGDHSPLGVVHIDPRYAALAAKVFPGGCTLKGYPDRYSPLEVTPLLGSVYAERMLVMPMRGPDE